MFPASVVGSLPRPDAVRALLGQADARNLSADVRKLLKPDDLEVTASSNLLKTLISVGDEDDLLLALSHEPMDASILRALGERERPSFDPLDALSTILKGHSFLISV